MKEFITAGVTYNLEVVSEEERRKDIDHMIKRGNHKSAESPVANAEALKNNYSKKTNGLHVMIDLQKKQLPHTLLPRDFIELSATQIIKFPFQNMFVLRVILGIWPNSTHNL